VKVFVFAALAAGAVLMASPALADDQGQGDNSNPMPPAGEATPAPAAAAPTTSAPPPTPGPVLATGGNVSGSNPGSSCAARLVTRNAPPGPSNIYLWNASGDSGWPFGWPGMAPNNVYSTTPPSVGCSR
jgi:hypothetical protein